MSRIANTVMAVTLSSLVDKDRIDLELWLEYRTILRQSLMSLKNDIIARMEGGVCSCIY